MSLHPKIKICGITNLADAEKSILLGADFLGFIQYSKSPRYVKPSHTTKMLEQLNEFDCQKVLVDVNPEPSTLAGYKEQGFDYFQLHFPCDLPTRYLEEWKEVVGIDKLWLAPKLPPKTKFPAYLTDYASHFVIDTFSEHGFGGTGKQSDWNEFLSCKQKYPSPQWVLAGGLGLDNFRKAMEILNPDIMDFNSALESEPGKKNHVLLSELFAGLKS